MSLPSLSVLAPVLAIVGLLCFAAGRAFAMVIEDWRRRARLYALLDTYTARHNDSWIHYGYSQSSGHAFDANEAGDSKYRIEAMQSVFGDPFAFDRTGSLTSSCINPASGLPMIGGSPCGFDVGGNSYGACSSSFDSWV